MTDTALTRTEAAEAAVKNLSNAVNGGADRDAIATAISGEHPTLAGQIAKAVGIGIVRRADYNPTWKPWDRFSRPLCTLPRGVNYSAFSDEAWAHPDHDGRLDCSTVVGALLMARQSYV